MNNIKIKDKRWIWIGLGGLMILLRVIAGYFPSLVESVYSRGIFQIVRYAGDYTVSFLPFPLIYVLIAALMIWLVFAVRRSAYRSRSFGRNVLQTCFSVLAFLSGLVFFFLLLWGFNYARVPIEDQLKLEVNPLTREEMKISFTKATKYLNQAYAAYHSSGPKPGILENNVRNAVVTTLSRFNYPAPGKVRARQLRPKGILLRISTAGVYIPFVGECHVDAGLHPLQVPFVMAHEMAHGYGITDEGSCNFIALRACLTSQDPHFVYSACLSYWKTLAYNFRSAFPREFEEIKASLDDGILRDMREIRATMDRYPDIFPKFRNLAYNTYLKTQGISEGMANYSRVILLEAAFQRNNERNQDEKKD